MATHDKKKAIKEALDAPITPQEVAELEAYEHLAQHHPGLRERDEVSQAVNTGWRSFKFDKWDLLSSIGFGAVFGTVMGAIGWISAPYIGISEHAAGELFGAFGLSLGAHSAIMHPLADATKEFCGKCKEGYTQAMEHNQTVQAVRTRLQAIRRYKDKHFTQGVITNANEMFTPTPANAEAYRFDGVAPESRAAKSIIAERGSRNAENAWTQRAESNAVSSAQLTL